LTGEGGSRLETLLEERYLSFFTKGGKPRTGKQAAPLIALEAERDKMITERQQRLSEQQQYEEAARAIEDARQQRHQTRREADALRENVAQTRLQAELYLRLQSELEQKRQTELGAKERYDAIGQTLELIRKARDEAGKLESAIATGVQQTNELDSERKLSEVALEDARRARDEIRRQRNSLDVLFSELEDARAYLADSKARQTLFTRLEKLRQLESKLKDRKQQRAAHVAPDDKTIRAVRKSLSDFEKAQASLQASLIHLTIGPTKTVTAKQTLPEENIRKITAGKSERFSGSVEVEITIEGFGTVRASGPEGGAEAHQETLRDSEGKVDKLTQPYGTRDPDRLQLLREQADELDRKVEGLETQITELLEDDDADALRQELAQLDARLKERSDRFPKWTKEPPVVADLKATYDKKQKTITDAIELAEDAFEKTQSKHQAFEKRYSDVAAELKNARLNLEATKARLDDLIKDGISDESRKRSQQEALMQWDAAKLAAKTCETQLNEIPGDPQKTLGKLDRQLKALEEAEATARDSETKAQTKVDLLSEDGSYSKLVACEEKLTELERLVREEKLRMDASQLLYDTVMACKAAAVASVSAPVERTATRMLSRIAGSRLGSVRLTENFVPTAVQPEIASETVELSNLSGGEQEQLFLITRLALGQVLAKQERQLVVLDDVLNATDTGRLARLLTLLEEAADNLQIIILTCHPERYRALEQAKFFNLQEMI
jgi:chromosome segregation ATPase